MKHFKLFLGFLVALIVTFIIFSFFIATSQKVEKSITIKAPAAVIFEQLAKLENFNKWSSWNNADSSVIHTITGTDGTAGAITTWKGHPEISGEGKMEITDIETNRKVSHTINFISPKKIKATSVFQLNEINAGETTITWKFEIATPRPWNIFNLFYSMEKEKGKEFESSLATLKKIAEAKAKSR
jgi:uncharacterized protein YndB with AHSA1/START domain